MMIRRQLVLVLLSLFHITMPMEKEFFNLTQPDFCKALPLHTYTNQTLYQMPEQNVFYYQKLASMASLSMQAVLFVWLKKNDYLFGTQVIPQRINISSTGLVMRPKHVLALCGGIGFAVTLLRALPLTCMHSNIINNGIDILLTATSLVHISNLVYDDALIVLKKYLKKVPVKLTIHKGIDIAALSDAKCGICFDDEISKKYINPCAQEDHIFCENCLSRCLCKQREESNFKNKESFFCDLCRKLVPFNNEKFDIVNQDGVPFNSWVKEIWAIDMVYYCIGLFVILKILQCQFF
jgi:hypothetical protein